MGRPVVLTAEERKLREIGHKRFSKLLHTRVAHRMKPLLGKTKWANFVTAALTFGKPLFMSAFKPDNVWCRGPIGCNRCPHGMGNGRLLSGAYDKIHGDHTIDLNNILSAWTKAHNPSTKAWHGGLKADFIVSAIFEFSAKHIVFWCEACHRRLPHYRHAVFPEDVAQSGTITNPIVINN